MPQPNAAGGTPHRPLLLPEFAGEPRPPLAGLTVLAVEDSRYACDAMRLMCQRLGARFRRADTLAGARAHLRTYRPDVVIVDLGLPDGRGEVLIRDLTMQTLWQVAVIGISGDPAGRQAALAAGAVGFLEKPLPGLRAFAEMLGHHLPARRLTGLAPPLTDAASRISPDPLALQDDLVQAARVLDQQPDARTRSFVARFVGGVARAAGDLALTQAAHQAETGTESASLPLRTLLDDRLARPAAFIAPD